MTENYKSLWITLTDCFHDASEGKGKVRHASGEKFEDQPIMWIEKYFHGYQLGQAVKKIHESQRLPDVDAIRELRGAINYLSAHILFLEDKEI